MSHSTSQFKDLGFPELLHGLPCIRLQNAGGHALIAAQGAQPVSWVDRNGKSRLYLSADTLGIRESDTHAASGQAAVGQTVVGQAIRGGIPVCFPQFSGRGPLVKHGFARNRLWKLESAAGDKAVLGLPSDEDTMKAWPHPFHAGIAVALGRDSLTISLTVTNTGDRPLSFTAALHTYLQVDDILNSQVLGLEGVRYQDATDNDRPVTQRDRLLKIEAELDRVYCDAPGSVQLLENGKASLLIEQQGFADTVVWNPGPEKARALADFPDDDWLRMLCIEAACVIKPVELPPAGTWTGSQSLRLP